MKTGGVGREASLAKKQKNKQTTQKRKGKKNNKKHKRNDSSNSATNHDGVCQVVFSVLVSLDIVP